MANAMRAAGIEYYRALRREVTQHVDMWSKEESE